MEAVTSSPTTPSGCVTWAAHLSTVQCELTPTQSALPRRRRRPPAVSTHSAETAEA